MSKGAYRLVTGTTLGALAAGALWLHARTPAPWEGSVVWTAAVFLSVLGAFEVTRMEHYRADRLAPALPLGALLTGVPAWVAREELASPERPWLLLVSGAAMVAVLGVLLVPRKPGRAALLGVWSAVPLYGLVSLDVLYGVRGLAVLIVLSKVGDVFGYFVGKAIGKRRPFPNVSPNKTVAGCVASLVAGAAAGAALGLAGSLPGEAGWLVGAVVGSTTNVAAQSGDLWESKVKRRGGVKDSGRLCAAAGGVLDVVDSLLFTVPTAVVLWPLVLV